MRRLVISAPFGNHFRRPWATSTLGTYTVKRRAGKLVLWWRMLTTVRYYRRLQAWVNRLGLPSPGIDALDGADISDCILSVHGFSKEEWAILAEKAGELSPLAVEANLSCPNIEQGTVAGLVDGCIALKRSGRTVIAKLPPVGWRKFVGPLLQGGVRHFHLCNSFPTPGGGMSGKPVKPLALEAVREVRDQPGVRTIIGGGGVVTPADALDYLVAGADIVAMGSALFNPLTRNRRLLAVNDAVTGWCEQAR